MEPPTSGRRLHANSTPCELVAQPAYNPGGPSITVGKTIHLCLLPVGLSCTLPCPPDEPRWSAWKACQQLPRTGFSASNAARESIPSQADPLMQAVFVVADHTR